MAFVTKLVVREHGSSHWKLEYPLIYKGNQDRFIVPAGFLTDFASVPRAFWSWIPRAGKHTKAAVVHDYLYIKQPVSRRDADGIFRRMMRELGVSAPRAWIMWKAVRVGGRSAWNRAKAKLESRKAASP